MDLYIYEVLSIKNGVGRKVILTRVPATSPSKAEEIVRRYYSDKVQVLLTVKGEAI